MKQKKLFLHTPPGSKPLYMEEALMRNVIEKKLCSYFDHWSYLPIETPIIDYFDIYTPFLSEKQKKGSIRFVDRDGNLVLLRNDITLFAAKALAARMAEDGKGAKYYYSGQIMRCREKDAPEEYYQIGCEIVGNNFKHEEFEILCVLIESCKHIGVDNFKLHIGDISFFNQLLDGFDDSHTRAQIFTAIRKCDIPSLKEILEKTALNAEIKDDLLRSASFIGGAKKFMDLALSDKANKALLPLKKLVGQLIEAGYDDFITVDLSELSELDYYNGVIFHVYAEGVEMPLVSGGRYDLLFKQLGVEKNAVGFSYWLYPLEKVLNSKLSLESEAEIIEVSDENFVADFKKAINQVNNNIKVQIKGK